MSQNRNSTEIEFQPSGLTFSEKAFSVCLWIFIEVFGNGLIIGLIQFDRLGGDPLKRRITDQVLKNQI